MPGRVGTDLKGPFWCGQDFKKAAELKLKVRSLFSGPGEPNRGVDPELPGFSWDITAHNLIMVTTILGTCLETLMRIWTLVGKQGDTNDEFQMAQVETMVQPDPR